VSLFSVGSAAVLLHPSALRCAVVPSICLLASVCSCLLCSHLWGF
jgi:hypothetical protein